jgi:hypothetical protein
MRVLVRGDLGCPGMSLSLTLVHSGHRFGMAKL